METVQNLVYPIHLSWKYEIQNKRKSRYPTTALYYDFI